MRCPSCGVTTKIDEPCIECGHSPELPTSNNQSGITANTHQSRKSTLIEFPGVTRSSVPEWRKELSVRVREVQERRAREAAREAAEVQRQRIERTDIVPPQLELLPQAEAQAVNPLVAAALRRIERANQSAQADGYHHRVNTATAIAYAPSLEVHDAVPDKETAPSVVTQLTHATPAPAELEPVETKPEKIHNLVVVSTGETATEIKVEKPRAPKRLIVDDPNDPALNYLDSIPRSLRVEEVANNRASAFRRMSCAVFDLLTCAIIASPIGLALYWKSADLTAARPLTVLIISTVILMFLYFTLSIGMTGRTWAMRMFSMRVVDIRTGLIPTGSQSAGRAFLYLFSIAIAGLGILYALISREGDTMHDRFTRTAVIKI